MPNSTDTTTTPASATTDVFEEASTAQKATQTPGDASPQRHRGRLAQIPIYLGKFLRMFVYQSDWKALPMAAVIAALVALAIRSGLFITMEGTLKGAFAFACVGIWNGFFNSIQVICRERDIVKREHRSGMHISSYVVAHMLYQALLCAGQTAVTMYVFKIMGIAFPKVALLTPFSVLDMGITMFLVTYAADMMALFVSSVARTTTAAMTVMPFILIFQLVFSGGIFALPEWCQPVSNLTISNYGIACFSAQGRYNELPMAAGWNTLSKMRNKVISTELSVKDVLSLLPDAETSEALGALSSAVDESDKIPVNVSVGEIIDVFGEDKLRETVERETAAASRRKGYDFDAGHVLGYWSSLGVYALVFAGATAVSLKFIDKDRR